MNLGKPWSDHGSLAFPTIHLKKTRDKSLFHGFSASLHRGNQKIPFKDFEDVHVYGQKSRVDSHTREKKLLPLAWCNTPAKCLDLRNAHIPMLYEKKTVLCLTHKP